jgi:hypothetical protein
MIELSGQAGQVQAVVTVTHKDTGEQTQYQVTGHLSKEDVRKLEENSSQTQENNECQ